MQVHPEIVRAAQGLRAALLKKDPNTDMSLEVPRGLVVADTFDQYVVDLIIRFKGERLHYALMQRPDGTVYNIPVLEA